MSLELFQESYQKTLFMESLIQKKELTLAESVYVLQNEEYYLTEAGLFGKLGGVADKAIDTVIQKILDNGKSVLQWVNQNILKGKGKEKTNQEKLVAKNVKGIAQLAGTDKESFFQKVSKWAGTSYLYVKSLFDDLNASLEKIPLIGKFIKMVPAKYRAMILGVVVMMVAKMYISGSFDGADASGNDMSQSTEVQSDNTQQEGSSQTGPLNLGEIKNLKQDLQNVNFTDDVKHSLVQDAGASDLNNIKTGKILNMRILNDFSNGKLTSDDLKQFIDNHKDTLPKHTINHLNDSLTYIQQHDVKTNPDGSHSFTLKTDTQNTASSAETPKNDLDADVSKIETLEKMDNTFKKINTIFNNPNLDENVGKQIFSKIADVIGTHINEGRMTHEEAFERLNQIDIFKEMGKTKIDAFIDLSLQSAESAQKAHSMANR